MALDFAGIYSATHKSDVSFRIPSPANKQSQEISALFLSDLISPAQSWDPLRRCRANDHIYEGITGLLPARLPGATALPIPRNRQAMEALRGEQVRPPIRWGCGWNVARIRSGQSTSASPACPGAQATSKIRRRSHERGSFLCWFIDAISVTRFGIVPNESSKAWNTTFARNAGTRWLRN